MVTEEKMCVLKTIVNLMKNKITGDIVGVVYTLDITEQERNANTLRILFDREYEGRAIINVKNKTYTLGRFDYEPGVVASSVDMDNRPLEDYSILQGKPVNVRELCGILSKQIAEYRK